MTDIEENSSAAGLEGATRNVVVAPPPRGLSIPAKRLAGSPACLNCGTVLSGPFCHYCGQPDKNLLRFFPVLLREMLADFLDFDSRFARTMKPLLFHPGKLTRDYLDGRRFRYTPPLRLYIFASMAFFLIAAMLASSAITINKGEDGERTYIGIGSEKVSGQVMEGLDEAVESGDITEAEKAELLELVGRSGIVDRIVETAREDEQPAGADAVKSAEAVPPPESQASEAVEQPAQTEGSVENSAPNSVESSPVNDIENDVGIQASVDGDTININGQPWDRETNPVIVPFMPDFINDWINNEIEESPQKGREIEANPNIIIDKVLDVLPIAVFIMLPLVALILKFWYLFSGHYYIEHLIHALHNHAFLFVIFILMILADAMARWKEAEAGGPWTEAAGWIDIVLVIWIPLYLLISLKKVYRQGWTFTLFKFSLVGVSYLALLTLVTTAAAVAGFVLL
jgi:hypothetical protein